MGEMEEKSRSKRRKGDLQKIILNSVAAAGILAVGFVAPNVIGAMAKFGLIPTKRSSEVIKRSWNRLIARGFLVRSENHLKLTSKGQAYLFLVGSLGIKKPKRWDKKWRVLIFDIPERRKRIRTALRRTLNSLGLVRLQDSVWVYPYDCEDVIALLKIGYHIGKDLLYLIVESMENDKALRNHFALPPAD